MKVSKTVIREFPQLVEALRLRGEMIKRGAADRVALANRIAALEAALDEARTAYRRLESERTEKVA